MRIRKNAAMLPSQERRRYVDAVKALKADIAATLDDGTRVGRYDQVVALHLGVTSRFLEGTPVADGGHGGPAFLPWHRQYLLMLEDQLRTVDSELTLPYWEWTDRRATADVLFQDDFMGPAGGGPDGRVASGPFTAEAGWPLIDEIHRSRSGTPSRGSRLLRNAAFDLDRLPSPSDLDGILSLGSYEASFPGRGFRRELEVGPHNGLHVMVGGTMAGMSSPNDPVFFLHHAMVDRLWAQWQADGRAGPDFYPLAAQPDFSGLRRVGHGLQEPMWPWDGGRGTTLPFLSRYLPDFGDSVRPVDVLAVRDLGYTYDSLLPRLEPGGTLSGVDLDRPGSEQGFRVVVERPGAFRLETGGTTPTAMSLYGPDGWGLVAANLGGGTGENARIDADLAPGLYFVVVRHAVPGGTGRFNISLGGRTMDEAVRLAPDGPAVQAAIDPAGDRDVFRFTAPNLGRYTIRTEGPTDVFMSLYGPDGPDSLVTEDDDSGQERNARITSRLTNGEYRVEVRHYLPTETGRYTISVAAEGRIDPTNLEVDGPEVNGEIAVADESDLYAFEAGARGTYRIETSGATDTFLTLYGPDDETLRLARDDDSGPGLLSRIEQSLDPGLYFVRVRHYSPTGTGPYGVRVRSA